MSGFIHVVACVSTSFLFLGWIIFHCIDMPHFVCPFVFWCSFGWFLPFDVSVSTRCGIPKALSSASTKILSPPPKILIYNCLICYPPWVHLILIRSLWASSAMFSTDEFHNPCFMCVSVQRHLIEYVSLIWDAWVAQSVKCLTLAQVMISRFVSLSLVSGSVLTAQSWSLLQILCVPLFLPLSCSCCLSQK